MYFIDFSGVKWWKAALFGGRCRSRFHDVKKILVVTS